MTGIPLPCTSFTSPRHGGSRPSFPSPPSTPPSIIAAALSSPSRRHCLLPEQFESLRSSPHFCNVTLVRFTPRGEGLLRQRAIVVSAQRKTGVEDSDLLTEDIDQGGITWNQAGTAQDGGDSDGYFSEILGVSDLREKNGGSNAGNRQWVGERGAFKNGTKLASDGHRGRLRENDGGRSETRHSSGAPSFQQTHIIGPARSRMASLSQDQPSRLQNKFSVFQRVTEPETLSAGPSREASSLQTGGASPRKHQRLHRENASYERDENLSFSQDFPKVSREYLGQAWHPSKENTQRDAGNGSTSSNLSTKLQAILGDFKRRIDPSIDERYEARDASDGLGDANVEDLKPEGPIEQPKSFWNRTEEATFNTGKDTQAAAEERYSLSFKSPMAASTSVSQQDERENLQTSFQRGSEAGLSSSIFSNASFDLFANPPPIPSKTNQGFSSTSQPDMPSRRGNMAIPSAPQNAHVPPRHLSRSIGSRSSPSRSSIPGKFSKYSRGSDLKNRSVGEVSGSRISTAASRPSSMSTLGESHTQLSSEPNKSVSSAAFSESDIEDDLKNWSGDEGSGSRISTGVSLPGPISSLPKSRAQLSSQSNKSVGCAALYGSDIVEDVSVHDSYTSSEIASHTESAKVSDLPFEYQYSYSETPRVEPLRYREPQFSPFGPTTMARPWTGRAPLKPSKKKLPEFDSFNPPPRGKKGVKYVQDPGPFPQGQGPRKAMSRDEILGEPLSKEEVEELVEKCRREKRQLNLGRDGLTHNMLDLVHTHWKRRRVCRVKCKGVPTVDMDNVCFHLEDKTGGKIILRTGGVVFLYRGRNYNYKDRPRIPLMLWKPAAPVYPKLIQQAPEGLTKEEANELRKIGLKVVPICKLGKNGVYLNLVEDVRNAFKVDDLVRINCQGLNPSDYKKIGAKLKDLVPCVLLSFEREHILMWKGRGLKDAALVANDHSGDAEGLKDAALVANDRSGDADANMLNMPNSEVLQPSSSSGIRTTSSSISDIGMDAPSDTTVGSDIGMDDPSDTTVGSDVPSDTAVGSDIASIPTVVSDEAAMSMSETVELVEAISPDSTGFFDDTSSQRQVKNASFEEVLERVEGSSEEITGFGKVSAQDRWDLDEVDVVSEGAVPSELVLQKLNNSREHDIESVREEGQDKLYSAGVATLWEQAIESGMAIELDKTDLDSDSVLEKAAAFAQIAPPGPFYPHNLLNILGPGGIKPTPDESSKINGGTIQAGRRPKKAAKQVVTPPMMEVPPMGGLPVDELARLLAP